MFNVPLIEFRRERLFELVDIRPDPGRVWIVLRRVHGFGMAQRGEVPKIEVIFRELKSVLGVILLAECLQDLRSE